VAIVAALVAALFYSLASLLQQSEAERQPPDRSLSPSLLTRLARRPRWVAGLGFDMAGYVMQWTALTWGSLVVVQPLLVVGLLFALPMKAHLSEYRLHGWDWSGALLVTSGLAVFLVVSRPGGRYAIPPDVRLERLDRLELAISSSDIRKALAAGGRPAEVPEAVLDYILAHGLYGTGAAA